MKNKILISIYSLFLSAALVISNKIVFTGNMNETYKNNYINPITYQDIIKFIVFFVLIYLITSFLIKKISNIIIKNDIPKKSIFFKVFILTLICFSIYLVFFFPGIMSLDSRYIIKDGYYISNQHPLMYILFLNSFFKIFSNTTIAIFAYTLVQMIIMAFCISYVINWIYKKGVNKKIVILLTCYYLFSNLFAIYSVTVIKDTIFSSFFMLLIPITYDILKEKKINIKQYIFLSIVSLLVIFSRNNGIIVVLLYLLIIILEIEKKHIFIVYSIILICIGMIPKIVSNEQLDKEGMALPLQQICAVIVNNGNISTQELKFFNNVLDINIIKKDFAPMSVDNIKWNPYFNNYFLNQNKKNILYLWMKLFKENKSIYIKQYIMQTLLFWKPDIIEPVFVDYYQISIKNFNLYSFSPDLIFWSTLFLILLIFKKKCYIILKLLIPSIGLWISILTCTPIAMQIRYVLPFFLTLPVLYILYFKEKY